MESRQPLKVMEKNSENSLTNFKREKEIDTSAVSHRPSQSEFANASDVRRNCVIGDADKISKTGLAYAPARISRPLRNHFADVVSEVLEEASKCNVLIIDKKIYDCDYDTHYATEIMKYMRKLELRKRLPSDYLSNRTGSLNSRNRAIIVDWLIQVQHYLKLKQETLYLTIFIFDNFFVKVLNVSTDKLQLVAISCVLIASKIEERFSPELSVLLHLTENAYDINHVLKMERFILNTLGFQLVMPDPMVFLDRCFQAANNTCKQMENLSTFLIDTLLSDVKVCRELLPSQMAASAYCLARKLLVRNEVTWDATLEHYSGYREENIKETMIRMLCAVAESADPKYELQGTRTKYASKSTYQNLSSLPVLSTAAIMKIIEVWTGSEEIPVANKVSQLTH